MLEGLTTAIVVDQERLGADARSTVGTATDAMALLRILFSRIGQPQVGPPSAFSFNVPSVRASGAITVDKGDAKAVSVTFSRTGGMCPRCEGRGTVSDIDLTALYDDSKSLAEGAFTIPGWKSDSFWTVRVYVESGLVDPHKPIREYTKKELNTFLYGQPTKVKVGGRQPDLRGADPEAPQVFLLEGSRLAAAAHPRLRGASGDLCELSRLWRHPAKRGRALVAHQGHQHRRGVRNGGERPGRLDPRARRGLGHSAPGRVTAPP